MGAGSTQRAARMNGGVGMPTTLIDGWEVRMWSDGVTLVYLPEDRDTYGLDWHEAYHWCVEEARRG